VAVVLSLEEFARLRSDRRRFGDAYRAFLENYPLDEVGLDRNFAASIRDRSPGRKVKL
jgi:hypothetical protein